MNILIIIVSVIAALVILILVIALFVKKEYRITREVVIAQPRQRVFEYIRFLKNQDSYAVWNQIDPAMQRTYAGTDGEVGFRYSWDSTNKKAGKGEQEITGIAPGQRVDMGLHFIKPFEGHAIAAISTTDVPASQTKVTWSLDSKMNYPMNIMLLFMNMDKMIGNDLSTGLANLKGILEK